MAAIASPAPQEDHSDVVDFLRRLADVMSGGQNAGKLLDAAAIIESATGQAVRAEQLWREGQEEAAKNIELRKVAEMAVAQLESDIITLNAQLSESAQQSAADRDSFAEEASRLSALAEDAQAQFARADGELCEVRSLLAGIGDTRVVVPVQSLRIVRAQFDDLAERFAGEGDLISQMTCEIGGCTIAGAP